MGTYVSGSALVLAHIPGRTISATSTPTSTTVDLWIVRAENQLTGALRAAGITTPVTDTEGISTIETWVLAYVVGLVEKAYASAGGDHTNESGDTAIEGWSALLADIRNADSKDRYNAMLWAGAEGAGEVSQLKSHIVNGGIDSADYAPKFERADWEKQF